MAGSTLRAYASGKRRYLDFFQQCGLQPLPLSESMLLRFAAYLASSGLSCQTVRLYLSAVGHLQILCIKRDPSLQVHPLLNYALRGLHRCPVGKPRLLLPQQSCRRFSSFGHVHHISVSIHCYGQHFAWDFMISCAQVSSPAHQCQLLILIC